MSVLLPRAYYEERGRERGNKRRRLWSNNSAQLGLPDPGSAAFSAMESPPPESRLSGREEGESEFSRKRGGGEIGGGEKVEM